MSCGDSCQADVVVDDDVNYDDAVVISKEFEKRKENQVPTGTKG